DGGVLVDPDLTASADTLVTTGGDGDLVLARGNRGDEVAVGVRRALRDLLVEPVGHVHGGFGEQLVVFVVHLAADDAAIERSRGEDRACPLGAPAGGRPLRTVPQPS